MNLHVRSTQLQQLLTIVNSTFHKTCTLYRVLIKSQKYLRSVWIRGEIIIFVLFIGLCLTEMMTRP